MRARWWWLVWLLGCRGAASVDAGTDAGIADTGAAVVAPPATTASPAVPTPSLREDDVRLTVTWEGGMTRACPDTKKIVAPDWGELVVELAAARATVTVHSECGAIPVRRGPLSKDVRARLASLVATEVPRAADGPSYRVAIVRADAAVAAGPGGAAVVDAVMPLVR